MNKIIGYLLYFSLLWIVFLLFSLIPDLPYKGKKMLRYIGLSFLFLFLFLFHSFCTSFNYWPWTINKEYYSGNHMGFEIGKDKYTIFKQLIRDQNKGKIGTLGIINLPANLNYKDYLYPTINDYPKIAQTCIWETDIKGTYAFITLFFNNSKLKKIKICKYYGMQK